MVTLKSVLAGTLTTLSILSVGLPVTATPLDDLQNISERCNYQVDFGDDTQRFVDCIFEINNFDWDSLIGMEVGGNVVDQNLAEIWLDTMVLGLIEENLVLASLFQKDACLLLGQVYLNNRSEFDKLPLVPRHMIANECHWN